MVLRPFTPPIANESTVSWCSRIAKIHANMPCVDWLKFMKISRQHVMEGSEYCVERLTVLTGVSSTRVRECGYQKLGERTFEHKTQKFGMFFAMPNYTTYCPACLLDDGLSDSPSGGLRIGRVGWVFSPVRTCPIHGIELHRRPNVGYHERFQDMNRVAPEDEVLEQQVAVALSRAVSPLQSYVERRFAGQAGPAWLDSQQIDQATRACEMLGACMIFGAHAELNKLSTAQWDEAGATGFTVAVKVKEGIKEALDRIVAASFRQKSAGGPQAALGRLYQSLQFNKASKDPGPIRDLVREFILDTMPIAAGTNLFGETVEKRRLHSVATLAAENGMHRKTLNRALMRTGILPDGDEEVVDERAFFSACAGETLVDRIRCSIPINKLPEYLNCNRTQAEMLVRKGILKQLVPDLGAKPTGVLKNVAIEDVDQFLRSLRKTGVPVEVAGDGMVNLIQTAEIARLPVADIVQLLLERRLVRVEILAEELKFRSLLVDPGEVRSVLEIRDSEEGLNAGQVADRIGLPKWAVSNLRKFSDASGRPFLRAEEFRNARGSRRYRYPTEDVERFRSEHVLLAEIARSRGLSIKATTLALIGAGVVPILPRNKLNAAVYRRADL